MNLNALLTRLREYGVTLDVNKCIFSKTEKEFIGHKITQDGILPLD